MPIPRLALQLYSLRQEFKTQPPHAFESIPSLGYQRIETAGDYGWSAAEWQEKLAANQLEVEAAHLSLNQLENDLEATLEFQKAIGNDTVVVPALPPELRSMAAGFREAAARFMKLALLLHQAGFRLLYHNHAFEFAELADTDSGCGMDILLAETDPDLVAFEFDTYWLHRGGLDAAVFLHRHANRVAMVHAKEYRALDESDTVAGEGNVDFRTIVSLAKNNDWPIVVEYEGDNAPETVKASGEYFRNLIAQ